jgi:Holliday junction resolvasome RuvABC ATP-dependent DNA helicase subunit
MAVISIPFSSGPKPETLDLCEDLLELKFADMLFIDECHRLAPRVKEVLYMALDRECVPGIWPYTNIAVISRKVAL